MASLVAMWLGCDDIQLLGDIISFPTSIGGGAGDKDAFHLLILIFFKITLISSPFLKFSAIFLSHVSVICTFF